MEGVPSDSDADLVDRCRSGMPGALGELCARHFDSVYRIIRSIVGERCAAEDCTQDTFLVVCTKFEQYQGTDQVRAWLFQIARNKALEYVRKRRPQIGLPVSEDPAGKTRDPAHSLINDELREQLGQALLQLPQKWRIAWQLHEVEGFPFKEIAAILRVETEAAARGLHFRAQQRLRTYLEEHGLGPD